ncbi:MAG: tail fiber domain-containing protein [Bacteroidia bacterium]|nr:tail fiber domain-containing protein [Bacteroidia bacterium]
MPQNSQQGILGYHLVNSSLPYAWRVWYADPDGGYGVGALNLEIWEYPDLQGGGPCCRRRFRIETTYPSTTFSINPVSLDAQNRLHAYGFINISDSALKSRIRPLEEGTLEKVRSLQPVLYRWKGDTRQQLGFIAQKTHAILPEVIRPNHTLMGIDYAALTAILYRSVQELSCKIEDLENAIQLLEKDLAKYE